MEEVAMLWESALAKADRDAAMAGPHERASESAGAGVAA